MTVADQETVFSLLRETALDTVPAATSDRLLEAALEREGRTALLALVNRTGLTNVGRRAILDALRETFEPDEAPVLARAIVRQHSSVMLAGIGLLEGSRSAAALFAVRKPLRRGEAEIDEACDRAAARLGIEVHAERYVRRNGVPPENFPVRELAYAAAAAAPETLAAIREQGADKRVIDQLGRGIEGLLDELNVQTRTGSLNEFDGRLRDELHEAVVLTGLPDKTERQERSLDNLFRRRDLGDVGQLAQHLPQAAVIHYAKRALSQSNRSSKRMDRAVLALAMLEAAESGTRAALHDVVLECLEEADAGLAAGAVAALAAHAEDLPARDRQRVIGRFGTLPAQMQQELAPRLSGLAASAEEGLDVDSFLRWVEGAPDDERRARLRALKARWDTTVIAPEQATLFLATLARGIDRLPEAEQEQWREELVEGALSWMFRQGTKIVESSRALLAWPPFAWLVLEDLDLSLSLLRPDQARGLLIEVMRQAEEPAWFVASVAQADVEAEELPRVVVPVLVEAIRSDLRATDTAFESVDPAAQRRLLQSALIAAGQTRRRIEALGQTTRDAADAAAVRHGGAVLDALRAAEEASEGNEAIQAQFDAVRRAVATALVSQEARDLPDGVVRWRLETASRHSEVLEAPDEGCSPLRFTEGAPTAGVLRVLSELDQRVHSPRVVTAEERTHLRQDLLRCIDHIVDARLVEKEAARGLGSRPALGQLVWARWAQRTADPSGDLVQALSKLTDAQDRQQAVLKVDALAGHTPEGVVAEVVDAVPTEGLKSAWSTVTAGLANRLRQVASLEQEAKTRGVEVMERVAERLDPPLRTIEGLMVGYFRLRRGLSAAGWRPCEEPLGKELRYEQLDPDLHEIDGSVEATRFLVRSTGVRVGGRTVRRAVVEALEKGDAA